MCDLLWKYCKNIVNMTTFFFYSFIDFVTFFPPFSAKPLLQWQKKKKLYPYFGNGIATIRLSKFFFFFLFTSGTPRTGSRTGQRKFGITIAEIQIFLSSPFSSSLSYFWLNFGNGNTKIQSLSSKSKITLNSTYNAN